MHNGQSQFVIDGPPKLKTLNFRKRLNMFKCYWLVAAPAVPCSQIFLQMGFDH